MNELETSANSEEIDTIENLDAAVAEVFELMLNKACSPVETTSHFAASLTVTISISGSVNGTCNLYLDNEATTAIARALLQGSHEREEMKEDAARELCNMIAGSWKSRLSSEQASAKLSLPVASHSQNLIGNKRRVYNFEGNKLALALCIREGERIYLTTD